jgi:CDP-paratose 2-epimerase
VSRLLITGSSGLVGSEVAAHFHDLGYEVHGADTNQRAVFFGPAGDTRWNQRRLECTLKRFRHHEVDVRDREGLQALVAAVRPSLIVHCAGQPSHDRAAAIPFDDFDTNAGGTLNLLQAARVTCPESPFIHLSTNKVYGDRPNTIAMREEETRWDYADPSFADGIPESLSIDRSTHSIFGASKVASDVMVQEYGRYFGMPTCCLRGGCLTGPQHSGVELHGFLSYLIKCNVEGRHYKVFGYKGKQVRDNLHAHDVARFIEEFARAPRAGEVYNLGGGRGNSVSIIEAFDRISQLSGRKMSWEYVDTARVGDHICYISNLTKMRSDYPAWDVSRSLDVIFEEIHASSRHRAAD